MSPSLAKLCTLTLALVVIGVDLAPPLLFYLRELVALAARAVTT